MATRHRPARIALISGFATLVLAASFAGSAAGDEPSSPRAVGTHAAPFNSARRLVLRTPAGVTRGDVLIASLSIRAGAATQIRKPAGWSVIRRDTCRAGRYLSLTQVTYARVAGANELARATWILPSQTSAVGGMVAYRGAHPTAPVGARSGASRVGSSTIVAPSVRADRNTVVVAVFGHSGARQDALPAGSARRYDVSARRPGRAVSALGGDFAHVTAGPSGQRVARTSGRTACAIGQLIALRPASTTAAYEPPAPPAPPSPSPVPPSPGPGPVPLPPPGDNVILVDRTWTCRGAVNLDLVRVTMRTASADAIHLRENCSGRIGRIEVETWTNDGLKVNAPAPSAHDLTIGGGYIRCHARDAGAHQDGIQAMGGARITFRNLELNCNSNPNAQIFINAANGGSPTDIVCDGCFLGSGGGSSLFINNSLRSGARNTLICPGRFSPIRIEPGAQSPVQTGNTLLPASDARC